MAARAALWAGEGRLSRHGAAGLAELAKYKTQLTNLVLPYTAQLNYIQGHEAQLQDLQAQNSAAQQSAQAQADMRDKIAAAQADFDKTRNDYSRDRQLDLKEIDERISKLEERVQSATTAKRGQLEQALANIRVQRAAFASDIRAIGGVAATDWDQFKSMMVPRTPLGRVGQPRDIATVVSFLASEDAGWITGQIIAAAGGLS